MGVPYLLESAGVVAALALHELAHVAMALLLGGDARLLLLRWPPECHYRLPDADRTAHLAVGAAPFVTGLAAGLAWVGLFGWPAVTVSTALWACAWGVYTVGGGLDDFRVQPVGDAADAAESGAADGNGDAAAPDESGDGDGDDDGDAGAAARGWTRWLPPAEYLYLEAFVVSFFVATAATNASIAAQRPGPSAVTTLAAWGLSLMTMGFLWKSVTTYAAKRDTAAWPLSGD